MISMKKEIIKMASTAALCLSKLEKLRTLPTIPN
jgi:hypothetical protein